MMKIHIGLEDEIMAIGPSLRKLTAHRAIHNGAFSEARDLTEVVERLFHEDRIEECLKAAKTLIEHWESRVIAHADAEEDGFYQEIVKNKPELEKDIHMLTRDHDLLRIIVGKIKEEVDQDTITNDVLNYFNSLLVVNEIHSRSEEETLLSE